MKYEFTPGPFTRILKKAENDPLNEYFLIVEEINRGNAPAIFGEIFQLLDRKDRDGGWPEEEIGESEYGITNYEVAIEVYEDLDHPVRIPSNLSVIATMNTADQNVFTLDTAFQRRWDMRHIKNDILLAEHAKEKIEGTEITWGAFAKVINDMVAEKSSELLSSEDKRLGAFFVKKAELSAERFSEKVLKYLWDDAFRMDKDAVFNLELNSLEKMIMEYQDAAEDRLRKVLREEVYEKMVLENSLLEGVITEE